MSNLNPADRPIIHRRSMAWDTKIAIGLFTTCIVGPAVMTHPSFWAWVVTAAHFFLMIAFYFVAKHAGRREEREEHSEVVSLNNLASVSMTSLTNASQSN